MQTRNDGTHVILTAAAPIDRRPDRARLSVTMLRQSAEKCATPVPVLQKSSAATPSQSAEDCTAHRNSTPDYGIATLIIE